MKANELRIGNLVINKKINKQDKSCWVTGFLTDNLWVKYRYTDQYLNESENEVPASLKYDVEPIPLTEEWLIKFGFEPFVLDYSMSLRAEGVTDFVYIKGNKGLRIFNNRVVNIEYVHQLQNLYFALTGTELELTPKS